VTAGPSNPGSAAIGRGSRAAAVCGGSGVEVIRGFFL
jgi:hypothetical protein